MPEASFPILARDSAFPRVMKAEDAGLVKCVCRRAERISSMQSPEPIAICVTKIFFPLAVFWPSALKACVASLIQFSFSDP
jgi:hypothetical protein